MITEQPFKVDLNFLRAIVHSTICITNNHRVKSVNIRVFENNNKKINENKQSNKRDKNKAKKIRISKCT